MGIWKAINPILSRAKLPNNIVIVSELGGLMQGLNNQSSIRIEDLTFNPYCTRFQREPNAKMKVRDRSNTMCINGE
jgi:hypothetical protein